MALSLPPVRLSLDEAPGPIKARGGHPHETVRGAPRRDKLSRLAAEVAARPDLTERGRREGQGKFKAPAAGSRAWRDQPGQGSLPERVPIASGGRPDHSPAVG